jgi:outer membrane protein OmpA-like peptidoglycan-associated protein
MTATRRTSPNPPARTLAALAAAAAATAAAAILAPTAHANVIGTGAQNFNPTPDGLDFVTVQSSETLKPGIVNFGFFLNYAVNSLPYLDSTNQGRLNFNDTLLSADLNAAIGLAPNWEVGLSLPQVWLQSVSSNGNFGSFASKGLTELRVMTKYRLLGDDQGGVAAVGTVNFNLIVNNPYVGAGAGPTWNAELVADRTFGRFAVAANVGYRAANPGVVTPGSFVTPIGCQVIASAAANYLIPSSATRLIAEVFGGIPTAAQGDYGNRTATAFEFLAGIKHAQSDALALHAGVGTELVNGTSSPDWRLYAGLNYTLGPVFKSSGESFRREGRKLVTGDIQFEFDSDRMVPESEAVLTQIAQVLREGPAYRSIRIEGHTDSLGADDYNQMLSERRAQAIKHDLIEKHGFKAQTLEAIGMGESEPIADNGNFQGRAQNRRVEFEVVE